VRSDQGENQETMGFIFRVTAMDSWYLGSILAALILLSSNWTWNWVTACPYHSEPYSWPVQWFPEFWWQLSCGGISALCRAMVSCDWPWHWWTKQRGAQKTSRTCTWGWLLPQQVHMHWLSDKRRCACFM
jgi:hypothetical protein